MSKQPKEKKIKESKHSKHSKEKETKETKQMNLKNVNSSFQPIPNHHFESYQIIHHNQFSLLKMLTNRINTTYNKITIKHQHHLKETKRKQMKDTKHSKSSKSSKYSKKHNHNENESYSSSEISEISISSSSSLNDDSETFEMNERELHDHLLSKNDKNLILTDPNTPMNNYGLDNDNWELIVRKNDILGSSTSFEGRVYSMNPSVVSRYEVIQKLGSGTFGQVFKCKDTNNDRYVAIKVLRNKKAYFRQGLLEVTALMTLNKMYDKKKQLILELFDHFLYCGHLCVVTELLGNSLHDLMKRSKGKGLPLPLIQNLMKQLLEALIICKKANIVHCDLKPENVLLCHKIGVDVKNQNENKDGKEQQKENDNVKEMNISTIDMDNLQQYTNTMKLKLIDLGSCCVEGHSLYSYIQSRFYRAPEVCVGYPYNCAIDMWSFGCLIAELFFQIPLFVSHSEYGLLLKQVKYVGSFPEPLLLGGNKTYLYFNQYVNEDDEEIYEYGLKSWDEYEEEQDTTLPEERDYFKKKSLKEIVYLQNIFLDCKGMDIDASQLRLTLYDFLKRCLVLQPEHRMTPEEALKHPLFNSKLTREKEKEKKKSIPISKSEKTSRNHSASPRERSSNTSSPRSSSAQNNSNEIKQSSNETNATNSNYQNNSNNENQQSKEKENESKTNENEQSPKKSSPRESSGKVSREGSGNLSSSFKDLKEHFKKEKEQKEREKEIKKEREKEIKYLREKEKEEAKEKKESKLKKGKAKIPQLNIKGMKTALKVEEIEEPKIQYNHTTYSGYYKVYFQELQNGKICKITEDNPNDKDMTPQSFKTRFEKDLFAPEQQKETQSLTPRVLQPMLSDRSHLIRNNQRSQTITINESFDKSNSIERRDLRDFKTSIEMKDIKETNEMKDSNISINSRNTIEMKERKTRSISKERMDELAEINTMNSAKPVYFVDDKTKRRPYRVPMLNRSNETNQSTNAASTGTSPSKLQISYQGDVKSIRNETLNEKGMINKSFSPANSSPRKRLFGFNTPRERSTGSSFSLTTSERNNQVSPAFGKLNMLFPSFMRRKKSESLLDSKEKENDVNKKDDPFE